MIRDECDVITDMVDMIVHRIRVITCTNVSEWNPIPYVWKCVMDMLCGTNMNICLYKCICTCY